MLNLGLLSMRANIQKQSDTTTTNTTNHHQSPPITTNTTTMTTTTTKNTIATLKNLITMIEIDHVSASEFAEYDCLNLIPDTKEAKIVHLQNLIIAELESAIA